MMQVPITPATAPLPSLYLNGSSAFFCKGARGAASGWNGEGAAQDGPGAPNFPRTLPAIEGLARCDTRVHCQLTSTTGCIGATEAESVAAMLFAASGGSECSAAGFLGGRWPPFSHGAVPLDKRSRAEPRPIRAPHNAATDVVRKAQVSLRRRNTATLSSGSLRAAPSSKASMAAAGETTARQPTATPGLQAGRRARRIAEEVRLRSAVGLACARPRSCLARGACAGSLQPGRCRSPVFRLAGEGGGGDETAQARGASSPAERQRPTDSHNAARTGSPSSSACP